MSRSPKSPAPAEGEKAGVKRRPSSLLDTRVIYCGDNLEQLKKLPGTGMELAVWSHEPPTPFVDKQRR